MGIFTDALEITKVKISKYDPMKVRPIYSSAGNMDVKKFSKYILDSLGPRAEELPGIIKLLHDPVKLSSILEKYAAKIGVLVGDNKEIVIPEELKNYTLNVNITAGKGEEDFFLTTEDEFISKITGKYYISKCKMPMLVAFDAARPVIPEYNPRLVSGVTERINHQTLEKENVYNTYIPPEWKLWRDKNLDEWKALPQGPPESFMKLVKHLFPLEEERMYLYSWMRASIMKRSYVYLVLCGAPGSGKNRLKLVMKALHGRENTVDGKKSTLTERFNSQLSKGTLTWFDELKYDSDMENVMKEMQNDYFSIERKGVDATQSSTIYSSMVISNNKPRDNYIAFDARKFAPLVVRSMDLKKSMTPKEINSMSEKLEVGSETFDVRYVAQIAKWLLYRVKDNNTKWPNLEYKGPMLWTLAHTSMSRWQKKAVSFIVEQGPNNKVGWRDDVGAYLWSELENRYTKRTGPNAMVFPDYSTIRAFFDVFRDGEGEHAFRTELVPGNNFLGDFYIYPLKENVEIITETAVLREREMEHDDDEEEIDL